jgi:hypothetical protein
MRQPPLCSSHHHLVHEGGWTLTLTPDRTITLTRPDGTIHHHGTTTNRASGTRALDDVPEAIATQGRCRPPPDSSAA